jgi:hypothetical protein
VRFQEIRSTAEAIPAPGGSAGLNDKALIRIHPTRILSFGVEEPVGFQNLVMVADLQLRG